MSPLITAADEPAVRLVVFGVALLAIATRHSVMEAGGPEWAIVHGAVVSEAATIEARAIADAVVCEAKRLQQQSETST